MNIRYAKQRERERKWRVFHHVWETEKLQFGNHRLRSPNLGARHQKACMFEGSSVRRHLRLDTLPSIHSWHEIRKQGKKVSLQMRYEGFRVSKAKNDRPSISHGEERWWPGEYSHSFWTLCGHTRLREILMILFTDHWDYVSVIGHRSERSRGYAQNGWVLHNLGSEMWMELRRVFIFSGASPKGSLLSPTASRPLPRRTPRVRYDSLKSRLAVSMAPKNQN